MQGLDRDQFIQPLSDYRPAPLWVWNDEMSEEYMVKQLKELKSHGFGGAFVHPRPGLITEYLSEEWFVLWRKALDAAMELELKLYIYDENSYPSGFAGGHIPSALPDCLANAVFLRTLDAKTMHLSGDGSTSLMLQKPGHPIRVFAYEPALLGSTVSAAASSTAKLKYDLTCIPLEEWSLYGEHFLFFELGTPETNSWLGGFAYTDMLRPEVTRLFLETTYEAYRKQFGEHFGKSIPAIFTDEPEISPGNLFGAGTDFLPFSYWFAGQFEKRNGYDLKDHLPCLFLDIYAEGDLLKVDPLKVRYDYYCTVYDLWVNNSVRPISEWCRSNGIAYTGHYLEHNWPYPWGRTSPSVMSLYEYMHWPAIDMLLTSLLKENGTESHLMLTIREAHSAANQFNRGRVLCETYGAGGWDSTFEDYKRIADWLMVHGINFLNQHLTYSTIIGARKRDHPQSFDWRQPWWDEYTELNDYHSRLSYALSEGETHNRILLLNPTTSAYFTLPGSAEQGLNFGTGEAGGAGDAGSMENTRFKDNASYAGFLQLSQWLCDGQWDYDYGDEYIIERHGKADDGRFIVHSRKYELILIHGSMMHMKGTTVQKLQDYLKSGGQVVSIGAVSIRVDGILSDLPSRLAGHPNWVLLQDLSQLESYLAAKLSPRLKWKLRLEQRDTMRQGEQDTMPQGIAHLRRVYADGSEAYFIVNSGNQAFTAALLVKGDHAELWNPWSGEAEQLIYGRVGDSLQIHVELPPCGSILLRVYKEAMSGDDKGHHDGSLGLRNAETTLALQATVDLQATLALQATEAAVQKTLSSVESLSSMGPLSIRAEEDNVFVIDYCDLHVGSKQYKDVNVIHGGRIIYEHHGFPTNPWDSGVQFKRRLLDMESTFDEHSGFSAEYHFHSAPGESLNQLQLLVERFASYRILVNGHTIAMQSGESSLDHHIGCGEIGFAVRVGKNTITLQAPVFSVFLELEAIYLKGDFSVGKSAEGWVVGVKQPLTLGSWVNQGLPFYNGAVIYQRTFHLDPSAAKVSIRLVKWEGTVASVLVNGRNAGLLGVGTGSRIDLTSFIQAGENEVTVRICGSFKNLLGPHHDSDKRRNTAWPVMWKKAPVFGQPSPDHYDFIDYGLFEDFIIEAQH